MLSINNLNIKRRHIIYKEANICFCNNQIHGIIGSSGVGKTTLLKTLIGQLKFDGKIIYNGDEIEDMSDFVQKHVAYVDQTGSYFSHMSIKQLFLFYAKNSNLKFTKKSMYEKLNSVGLDAINVDKSPDKCSIGERKRLQIALALYTNKEIILLDEPTASLDIENIELLCECLREIKNKTIILTTHNENVLKICDTVTKIENNSFTKVKESSKQDNKNHSMAIVPKFSSWMYWRNKGITQWIQQLLLLLLVLVILIQSFLIVNIFAFQEVENLQYENSTEREMLYISKSAYGAASPQYSPGNYDRVYASTFEKNEIENIQNVTGIKDIYPYEGFVNTDWSSKVNSLYINENMVDQESELMETVAIVPYFPNNQFGDGIYISSNFGVDYNVSKGDQLKSNFFIPTQEYIYDVDEIDTDVDTLTYRDVYYTEVELSYTIDDIIDTDKTLCYPNATYHIYVPYQQVIDIINDYNISYHSNEYVLFVDEDQLIDVYETVSLVDANFQVQSYFLYLQEFSEQSDSLVNENIKTTISLLLPAIASFVVVQYLYINGNIEDYQLLRNIGITKKQIKKLQWFEYLLWLFAGICAYWMILKGNYGFKQHHILAILIGIYLLLIIISICTRKFMIDGGKRLD